MHQVRPFLSNLCLSCKSADPVRTPALLRILFRSQDLSEVKRYMYDQWSNILRGRVSIQDFTFAKEVRLGGYKCVCPLALQPCLASLADPRLRSRLAQRGESPATCRRRCPAPGAGPGRRGPVRSVAAGSSPCAVVHTAD